MKVLILTLTVAAVVCGEPGIVSDRIRGSREGGYGGYSGGEDYYGGKMHGVGNMHDVNEMHGPNYGISPRVYKYFASMGIVPIPGYGLCSCPPQLMMNNGMYGSQMMYDQPGYDIRGGVMQDGGMAGGYMPEMGMQGGSIPYLGERGGFGEEKDEKEKKPGPVVKEHKPAGGVVTEDHQ